MTRANVDVIIPIYNAASTLQEAVRSIQTQTYSAIRIVLIDDGSTDATPTILAAIAGGDSRVVILRQKNRGIVDALNHGWRSCDAPLIARHDADDIAAPDRLAKQVAFLEKSPEVVAVSGAFRHIDSTGAAIGEIVRLPSVTSANPRWVPAREPYLLHPFLMLRRAALETVGGYRHVFHAEDADLYWRLRELGTLVNLDEVLGEYRLTPNSISNKSIINGRIQSVSSQLAAISALRRQHNQPDINFPTNAIDAYHTANTLAEMVRVAGAQLTVSEMNFLSIAASQKLRQLSTYRQYCLEMSDCRFISQNYTSAALTPKNRRETEVRLAGAAARLLLHRKLRLAFALCPSPLFPSMFLRVLTHLLVPASLLRAIRIRLEDHRFWGKQHDRRRDFVEK